MNLYVLRTSWAGNCCALTTKFSRDAKRHRLQHEVRAHNRGMEMIGIDELSDTQRKALRLLAREPNMMGGLGGNGRGPVLSAARALERKGVFRSYHTSHYVIVEAYRDMAREELRRFTEMRKAAKNAP